jgi:hypothetical protein
MHLRAEPAAQENGMHQRRAVHQATEARLGSADLFEC